MTIKANSWVSGQINKRYAARCAGTKAWDGGVDPVTCYLEEESKVTIKVTIPAYGTALYAFSQQNLSGRKTAGVHAVQSDCPVAYDVDGNLVALVADGDSHTLVLSDGMVQAEQMPTSGKIDRWTLTVESWHPCVF